MRIPPIIAKISFTVAGNETILQVPIQIAEFDPTADDSRDGAIASSAADIQRAKDVRYLRAQAMAWRARTDANAQSIGAVVESVANGIENREGLSK